MHVQVRTPDAPSGALESRSTALWTWSATKFRPWGVEGAWSAGFRPPHPGSEDFGAEQEAQPQPLGILAGRQLVQDASLRRNRGDISAFTSCRFRQILHAKARLTPNVAVAALADPLARMPRGSTLQRTWQRQPSSRQGRSGSALTVASERNVRNEYVGQTVVSVVQTDSP